MRAHLFWLGGGGDARADARGAAAGTTSSVLPLDPAGASREVERVLREDPGLEVLAFRDPSLGAPAARALEAFLASRDDVWHAGSRLRRTLEPDLVRYVQPLWAYRFNPSPDVDGAVNPWLELRAAFVRAEVPRRLGSFEGGFASLAGAAGEMGMRWLLRGAVCRQRPGALGVESGAPSPAPPLRDAYRLLLLRFGRRWTQYTFLRRLVASAAWREVRAYRAARAGGAPRLPAPAPAAMQRDIDSVALPPAPRVSVVLPTFGRYPYLQEVLGDLRRQTVPPAQILVADNNPPAERRPEVFDGFGDLPLEVLWLEEGGTCIPRNACLARATGDYVWFVDDDSRLDERNLEMHLRVLEAYGADVSVGPATTRARPKLHPFQEEIAATFMDCGTTLCRREIIERVGGFDTLFNDCVPLEDAEIGLRFVRSGGLMVNNPYAARFHYLAPVGGARTSGNNHHRWARFSLRPRPAMSVYYVARRHFERAVALEAVFHAWLVAGLRRKEGEPASARWLLRTAAAELLALPVSLYRLARSVRLGREMLRSGPRIPAVRSAADADALPAGRAGRA